MKERYYYVQCPSCSYRHGPMSREDAQDIIGCPKENTKAKEHRYDALQIAGIKRQIQEQI